MPLDASFVGRTYPPTAPYLVGREKIREFATAIGATDPAYHDPQAARALGYRDVVAPPTFPVVIAMEAGREVTHDPAIGVDHSRVVHGDERFLYRRPVVAGDELVCVNIVEDITSRGGHDFLTTRTEVATLDGDPVVTVWSRIIVRGES